MKKTITALSLALLSFTTSTIYPYLLFPNGEAAIDAMSVDERAELKEYTIKYQNEYDKNSLSFDNINNIESCFTKKGCNATEVNWNGKYTLTSILRKLDQADKKAADIATSESVVNAAATEQGLPNEMSTELQQLARTNQESADLMQNKLFFSKAQFSDYMAMGIFMSGIAYIAYKVIKVRMAENDTALANREQI